MASKEPEHEHREDEEATGADDEDTGAQVAPIVQVAVTTGEENEDAILDLSFLTGQKAKKVKKKTIQS